MSTNFSNISTKNIMTSEKENEASHSPIKIYEDFRKARKNLG